MCGFYPLNHLYCEGREFHGDFTFFRRDEKSQIDFASTNKHTDIAKFGLAREGLEISDHEMITLSLTLKMDLTSNALLKWSKDSTVVGHTVTKCLFRVNFDINTEKMQLIL